MLNRKKYKRKNDENEITEEELAERYRESFWERVKRKHEEDERLSILIKTLGMTLCTALTVLALIFFTNTMMSGSKKEETTYALSGQKLLGEIKLLPQDNLLVYEDGAEEPIDVHNAYNNIKGRRNYDDYYWDSVGVDDYENCFVVKYSWIHLVIENKEIKKYEIDNKKSKENLSDYTIYSKPNNTYKYTHFNN